MDFSTSRRLSGDSTPTHQASMGPPGVGGPAPHILELGVWGVGRREATIDLGLTNTMT